MKGKFDINAVMESVKLVERLKPTAYNIIRNEFPKDVIRIGHEDTYIHGAATLCSLISDVRSGEYGTTEDERKEMRGLFDSLTNLKRPEYAIVFLGMSHVADMDIAPSCVAGLDIAINAAKILEKFKLSNQVLAAGQFFELAYCGAQDYNKAKLALLSTLEIRPDDASDVLHLQHWDEDEYPESESSDDEVTRNEVMRVAFHNFWTTLDPFSAPWLKFVPDIRANKTVVDETMDIAKENIREKREEDDE